MGELSRRMNADGIAIEQSPVTATQLAKLIDRITDNTIINTAAKQVFVEIWERQIEFTGLGGGKTNDDVDSIIELMGLKQMNDTGALEAIIDEVLAANPKNVEEFKAGNAKALNGLVGPIMKASKGKANPAQVNALLLKRLG